MTTVYTSSDAYFQQDNAPCHKAQIISDWFLEHDNEFNLLKWPPQSPNLNPIEHLWDVMEREICIMDVQPTNLQQLREAIMSISTKIYQTLLNLCHEELTQFWRQKGVQPGTSKVYLIKWPVSECVCIYTFIHRSLEIRGVRFTLHSIYSLASVTYIHICIIIIIIIIIYYTLIAVLSNLLFIKDFWKNILQQLFS